MLLESHDLMKIDWTFSVGFVKVDEKGKAQFANMRKETISQYVSMN